MVAGAAWVMLFVAASPALIHAGEAVWPMPDWAKATPAEVGMDEAKLERARDYALEGDGSGMIIRHGRLVLHWGDLRQRYDLKSTTKSFGAAALGLALKDGKIKGLDDKARLYHPTLGQGKDANAQPGWLEKMTIRHLLTQTAGFEKPGGTCRMLFEPGTKWAYSDSGPNWLAECITLVYQRDLNAVMFERLFTPIGIKPADLTWRHNAYRLREINGIMRREFGAGIHANVDAMARFGYLFLRRGRWRDQQLLPEDFVVACGKLPDALHGVPTVEPGLYGRASSHYGYLWWNNADGTLKDVPRDAYWSWGLYDSLIVVVPSLDIVVARAGKSLPATPEHYAKLIRFLGPIAQSVKER
ncbi:MAG TPA: serine hydrolase [Planctomycetota bacterium]|nr:serine hydrolase [Planctomycetota bacterium]